MTTKTKATLTHIKRYDTCLCGGNEYTHNDTCLYCATPFLQSEMTKVLKEVLRISKSNLLRNADSMTGLNRIDGLIEDVLKKVN